jgi:hypothetical protein
MPPQSEQAFALAQTLERPQLAPIDLHVLPDSAPEQQPVLHVSPAQQACPSPPHPPHCCEAKHRSPLAQLLPTATHLLAVGSQQPLLQVLPLQQDWPASPQA